MSAMKAVHMLAYVLLWIGGINWGLIGLFNFNLVMAIGLPAGVVQFVYVLVGVAAVYSFATHMTDCKVCSMGSKKR
jgi:uncharacterized protein